MSKWDKRYTAGLTLTNPSLPSFAQAMENQPPKQQQQQPNPNGLPKVPEAAEAGEVAGEAEGIGSALEALAFL